MDAFGAFGPAWERMKALLFRGSSVGIWFSLGFAFFLQSCAEEGAGSYNTSGRNLGNFGNFGNFGNGGSGGGSSSGGHGGGVRHSITDALSRFHWGGSHAASSGAGEYDQIVQGYLMVGLVLAVVVGIPLVILASWLGARGRSMAIRAVASGTSDIGTLWSRGASTATRFFKFQLLTGLIALVIALPAVLYMVFAIGLPVYRSETTIEEAIAEPAVLVAIVVLTLVFYLPLGIVTSLFRNFVFPISLRDGLPLGESWRMFWSAGRNNIGGLFLFFLARLIIAFAGGVLSATSVCCTCLLGAIPVIHQTIMAPFYVFERAHALYTLESLGPQFQMFGSAEFGSQAPPGFGNPYGGGPYDSPPGGGFGPSNPQGGYGIEGQSNPYAPPAGGYGVPPR